MYDAIVVGARVAGAPLAMLLARAGRRVLLLDDARADGPGHAEALTGKAVYRMRDWGMLEDLKRSRAMPVWKLTLTAGEDAVEIPYWGDLPGLCPRRGVLDAILQQAAVDAGVELRQGITVTGLLRDPSGRVSGIEGVGASGTTVREEAAIVVGADGRDSVIARLVDAPEYDIAPGQTCMFRSTWDDVPVEGIEAYFLPDRAVQVLPTNDVKATVVFAFPVAEFERIEREIDDEVQRSLELLPGLGLRLRCGKPEGPWEGAKWDRSYRRTPYGPGWALAGDAAFLKEPLLLQGVNDAFRDADGLAAAMLTGLAGGDMAAAFADHTRARDERTTTICEATRRFAGFEVTPKMLAGLASYAGQLMG